MLPHNTETPLGDSNHQISNSDHQPSDHEVPLSPGESENNNARKTGKWTSEEDDLLRKYVPIFGERQWRKISEHIPGRSSIQCLHRWTKILKPGLIKGPWTAEEDQKLVSWVKTEGATKWAQCSNYIKGRSGKQCRERWFNNLNPDVKKGNWSKEEDELIFQLYQKYGSSWSKIAKVIPGRTENAIKNRFYSTLRRVAADKKKMKVEHEEEMSGKEGETEKLELPMGNMTGSSNLLYALLNEKTQEKEEKGEEGHEGKEKGKETTEKQAFNVNGEKVVIARDVKKVNEKNIQEAATRLMNNEMEDNDAAFEEFLGTLSGGLEEDFLSREFESGRKADDVGHLEDLQKKVLTFCQNNIKDLAETFKMIEANKASTAVSESGISEGKVNLGKITGKQEGNTQKEMIRNKVLTPTPVNQKEVIRIQQWNGNPGIGHGGFSLYNSKESPKGGSEKSSEKAEDSKENKIEVEIKEKDKGNQEIEKRMVFLFQQLYSLERLLAKTRSDLIQFESDLKGGKDLGQENVKMEESEFDKVVKKKKV